MIIENQKVKVVWGNNKKYYESILNENGNKKYIFTKRNDVFLVDINDLTKGSKVLIKCKCDCCNEEIDKQAILAFSSQRHFCNDECKFEYTRKFGSFNNTRESYNCDYCNKEVQVKQYVLRELKEGKRKNIFCSTECHHSWQSKNKRGENNPLYNRIDKVCKYCSKEYNVPQNQKDRSKYCSVECRQLDSRTRIKKECANCEKEIYKTPTDIKKNKTGIYFCSHECHNEYKIKIHKEIRKCEYCENEYETKKISNQRFCSIQCQGKWQSNYLIGENANGFNSSIPIEDRMIPCDWCGENHKVRSPYRLKQKQEEGKSLFCSMECYREWYAKEWSQSEEWKEESAIRAVKMLEDGAFNHTDTEPQIILNDILDELNIEYINEYNCKVVSIDNYLPNHNLMIEVMGGYWHVDPRTYENISYQMQYDRVINDRRKRAIIKSQYMVNILYLWEVDLKDNPNMCMELIKLYIKNNGVLEDYNSFNYELKDDEIKLKIKYKPYIDYELDDLKNIFIPIDGKKRSMKQEDKWTTFNCDVCGEEKEQLISHYNKSKSHCCSVECAAEYRKGKTRDELRKSS